MIGVVFPVDLASVLSGASLSQLAYWRRAANPILMPEHGTIPRALYSFRDVVALRTVVKLRRDTSLQAIRSAFRTLHDFDLTAHPSEYRLVSHGSSIVLVTKDEAMDLVKNPGSLMLATLDGVFAEFTNKQGRQVVDLIHPRPHLDVREHRLGGWPTAQDTRVPYDSVALLMATGEVGPEDVARFYPTVSAAAAADALDFAREVEGIEETA